MNYTTDSTENWSIIPQCWPSLKAKGLSFPASKPVIGKRGVEGRGGGYLTPRHFHVCVCLRVGVG